MKDLRPYWRRRWRAKAKANIVAGLNTRGGVRLRVARLTDDERRLYNLAKFHARADRLAAVGKTARGTDRKYRVRITRRSVITGAIRIAVANCERMKAEATMRALTL